jgi:hypothetical protein
VIQKYNLGLNKLDSINVTNSKFITARVKMTEPDNMSIKSFLTLPEPTIRFSKVNLPGTTLLDKANLNKIFLNYWQFLNKKTNMNTVIIDNIDEEFEFNEKNFANSIKNFVLNLSPEDKKQYSNTEIYEKFVNTIVPKTKTIFELMKKYIIGKLSIVDIVGYLEPFLIYTDDLTYMQYVHITKFIRDKISEFNKDFVDKSKIFFLLSKIKSANLIFSNAYSILSIIQKNKEFLDTYEVSQDEKELKLYSNSEILKKISLHDGGRLYTLALTLQNIPLMFPNEFIELFEKEKKMLIKEYKNDGTTCDNKIIAKYYNTQISLELDNNKTIYFDKKFDNTKYEILDNYEKEINVMNKDALKNYIMNDLKIKQKLTDEDVLYLVNTLLDGHKKVLDGQYAILFNDNGNSTYYIRKNNKWVLDETIDKDIYTLEKDLLCDLQDKCLINNKTCESLEKNESDIQIDLLDNIMDEFDVKYKISKEEMQNKLNSDFNYYSNVMNSLTIINNNKFLKYNNEKYKLGLSIENTISNKIVSPYSNLLNLILSQSDFVKKQNDINKFVSLFTRNPVELENIHWLYCIKTNVPLLPKFKYEMAVSYIANILNLNRYQDFIDLLITKIGKLSDDGDYWVDKNSGWVITRIDFDVEEGYEGGFKIKTRQEMEEDAGANIGTNNSEEKYKDPESKIIINIINTLSIAMGINIEPQKEFIINNVISTLRETVVSVDEYNDRIKKKANENKKIMSFNEYYNTSILYYTLGLFLIATQTSIPSIKTRKTHPGCIRSFTGYPFEGAGDMSSINYLGCIAFDIRKSGEPWNVLKKKDTIAEKIKNTIDQILINLPEVTRKMEEKTNYLLLASTNVDKFEEYNLEKWTHFLPILIPFKIKNIMNITEDFEKKLIQDFKGGNQDQLEKILVIQSKIILFSLAIQEKIQDIVKKKDLLLKNMNGEAYLENACCQTKEGETTIQYFVKQDPIIDHYNKIVTKLVHIYSDIIFISKAVMLYSNINTKNKYPSMPVVFSEKTIYLSFIYFCKFKSLLPIPTELLPLCHTKPEFSMNESVDIIIQKMKDNKMEYNNESFLRLLQLIGRNNIIDIQLNKSVPSSLTLLTDTIDLYEKNEKDEKNDIFESAFFDLLKNTVDTFDIASEETSDEVKNLNDYLIENNEEMKNDILNFIKNNRNKVTISNKIIKKIETSIQHLSDWENVNSETIIQFYKNYISYFVKLFPNIILNKVDYSSVIMHKYLDLSSIHSSKLTLKIKEYYEKMRAFYDVSAFNNILPEIQTSCHKIIVLSDKTPSFSSIDNKVKPIFDESTSKYINEFYLLKVIMHYINLTDNANMIVTEVQKKMDENDIFSVDYLEEVEKRDEFVGSREKTDDVILNGNKKGLKQKVAELLACFFGIMNEDKEVINLSYKDILDRIFKQREKEKHIITDRLQNLTEEERDADTILKINKLGIWGKGLQKGLTKYVKETYDEEYELRDALNKVEKGLLTGKNVGNIDDLVDDYMEEKEINDEIEKDVYDLSYLNEDFTDGNFNGYDEPEAEYDDYTDYN